MDTFPNVDPIPLPAPVWLFKVLHEVTLSVHFTAVHLLWGGLFIGVILNWMGHMRKKEPMIHASDSIVGWLPIIMTYVINFGVPPLLFVQVLYGRAIYTSSILMGAYWISFILILIAAYRLLYTSNKRASSHRPWRIRGLISLLLIMANAKILVYNMTLMIRPEVWQAMYGAGAHGLALNSDDPTVMPRFLYMLMSSLSFGGLFLLLATLHPNVSEPAKKLMRSLGLKIAFVCVLVVFVCGNWFYELLSDDLVRGISEMSLFSISRILWLVGIVGTLAMSLVMMLLPKFKFGLGVTLLSTVSILHLVGMVLMRSCIRDIKLLQAGFDVWERHVVLNLPVVSAFLILFVAGLVVVGWLSSVAFRAVTPKAEV